MLRFLTTLILLLQFVTLRAATYNPDDYTYPVEGTERLYSGNFGEMRTDHFHSGVDIKTDGVEGKRVVASCDGYVSRIGLSPYGYGLVLYLAHPNGTTTVYGHLSELREDMQEYMIGERYRTKQHSLNLYPSPSQFPVKKGELIALSGNSGSSGGPHLHFEVRDSAQRPLNPVALGIITPTDNIRPMILNIYYAETQSIDGVCYTKGVSKYPVVQSGDGEYKLLDRDVMWVGREGYFIFETTDRRDGVTNTFGAYAISCSVDDKPLYNFQHDGFSFDHTRYCNAISYYPYQASTSSEFYRLKRLEGVPHGMIKYTDNSGVLTTEVGDVKNVVIKVSDDMKNSSKLTFTIKGKDDADCFNATPTAAEKIIRPSSSKSFFEEDVTITFPAGVLYEAAVFSLESQDSVIEPAEGVKIYSPSYSIMDPNIPLHSNITLSIKADIPAEEQPHVMMIMRGRSGKESVVDAEYNDGTINISTRSLGSFTVAVDNIAPVITPSFNAEEPLSGATQVSFHVTDNYSGLDSYSATLDGEWIALDLKGSTLTHLFQKSGDGGTHELKIDVSDRCGNQTSATYSILR